MTEAERKIIFETMPVKSAVVRQVIPSVAGQMVMLIYNLADTYFVGMLNQPIQTAAVTICAAPFLLLTALANLFGVGGASAISRALGQKNTPLAQVVSSTAFYYSGLVAAAYWIIFALFKEPLLRVCGATDETMAATIAYGNWAILYGGPATILSLMFSNLFRAEGATVKAFIGLSACGVLNIILDPLFTLPQFLGMGAAGAGLATALSNGCALVYYLILLSRKGTILTIAPKLLAGSGKVIGKILSIGFPSAIQLGLTVVAIAIQGNFVSKYSAEAVAALGIAKKLDHLPLYFSIGVATGIMPLLAYSDAAGNTRRCREAFRFGTLLSLLFSLLSLLVYEFHADVIASFFIKDAKTVAYAAMFVRRLVVGMPMMAVCYTMIILFQAMGKPKEAMVCSLARKGILDAPIMYFMDKMVPLLGCMWVQPIVDTLALVITGFCYRKIMRERVANSTATGDNRG